MTARELFSKNIRALLGKRGETGKEFADSIDVEPGTVYSWMKGRTLPGPNTLDRVANHFHVTVSNLYAEELKV